MCGCCYSLTIQRDYRDESPGFFWLEERTGVSVGVGGKQNRVIVEKSGTDIESVGADDVNINCGILYWRELF